MMKSKKRRPRRPQRTGTYRGFKWMLHTDVVGVTYYYIHDHRGKYLGGSSDYKGFIERWQRAHGVPAEIQRKQRERGTARVLAGFFANA